MKKLKIESSVKCVSDMIHSNRLECRVGWQRPKLIIIVFTIVFMKYSNDNLAIKFQVIPSERDHCKLKWTKRSDNKCSFSQASYKGNVY